MLDSNMVLRYSTKLRNDALSAKENEPNDTLYKKAFHGSLQIYESMLLCPEYRLDISDFPQAVRVLEPLLFVIALREHRNVDNDALPRIFRLMWDDICDSNINSQHKSEISRLFVTTLSIYGGEYHDVGLFRDEVQAALQEPIEGGRLSS